MQCFVVWNNEIEGRLDADFYKPEFRKHLTTLSGICFKELGEMVEFSNETWDQKSIYNDKFPYIEISEIDITSGEIKNIIYYEKEKAPSRAKMIVREDDIIVSTTRPHRGAISLIDESKSSYIASTGFAVLRGLKTDKASRDFLFHILKTSLCLNQMLQRSSGGNYPAITTEDLKKIKIPLPSLSIQNQIVYIMQSAYSQKKQMEDEARRLLDSIDGYVLDELGIKLPKSEDKKYFVVMSDKIEGRLDADFYNPIYTDFYSLLKKSKYQVVQLGEISETIFQGIGRNETKDPAVILLKVKNIKQNNEIDCHDVEYIKNVPKNKILQKDDIISPFIGEAVRQYKFSLFNIEQGFFTVDNNTGVIRIDKEQASSQYVTSTLNSTIGKFQIDHLIGGGGVPFLGVSNARRLKIPLPPLPVQTKIAEEVKRRMSEAERLKAEAGKIIAEAKKTVEDIILSKD